MIILQSERACQSCPASALCLSQRPLESLPTSFALCRKCYTVWFQLAGNMYVCARLRVGDHARRDSADPYVLIMAAIYPVDGVDAVREPRRIRTTSMCTGRDGDCLAAIKSLGLSVTEV